MENTSPALTADEMLAIAEKVVELNDLFADSIVFDNVLTLWGLSISDDKSRFFRESAKWTDAEHDDADALLELILRHLGSPALVNTRTLQPSDDEVKLVPGLPVAAGGEHPAGTPILSQTEASESSISGEFEGETANSRLELTKGLDSVFSLEEGTAEAWLRGANTAKAKRFIEVVSLSIGFTDVNATALLMYDELEGGVGLSETETKILSLGLGYWFKKQDGALLRHEVARQVFDEHIKILSGEERLKYRRQYYEILKKLKAFQKRKNDSPTSK